MLKIFIALIIVVLLGCDNSSSVSNDTRQNSVTGFYVGEFVIDGNGSPAIAALISEDGNMRLMFHSLLGQAAGKLTNSDNSYNGSLTLYQNHYENVFHTQSTDIQLEASIINDAVNGTWSDSTSSGRVHLNKLDDEGQITDPTQLSSNWILSISSSSGRLFTLSISIDSQGVITGGDTLGCTYLGKIIDISSNSRVIPFDMSMTSCGSKNGSYQGLMAATTTTQGDKLIMLASNSTYSFTAELNR